ncbi:MAG: hypothetical protein VX424_23955 [Actinomycetota bacterium]|nr:hypothetical protein [Actinomycetota bacterium]
MGDDDRQQPRYGMRERVILAMAGVVMVAGCVVALKDLFST